MVTSWSFLLQVRIVRNVLVSSDLEGWVKSMGPLQSTGVDGWSVWKAALLERCQAWAIALCNSVSQLYRVDRHAVPAEHTTQPRQHWCVTYCTCPDHPAEVRARSLTAGDPQHHLPVKQPAGAELGPAPGRTNWPTRLWSPPMSNSWWTQPQQSSILLHVAVFTPF